MLVKISNLIQNNGTADYKGLDLSKIIAGTQIYPPDKNEAYLLYDGELVSHADLSVINEQEYENEVNRIAGLPKPLTEAERISELEETMAILLMGGAGGV